MNILVIGSATSFQEVKTKFGAHHEYQWAVDHDQTTGKLSAADCVFDFLLMDDPARQQLYATGTQPVFVNSVNKMLAETIRPRGGPVFGFNGWPGCVERALLEVSCFKPEEEPRLRAACELLGTDYRLVDDRVGLVTPRVLAMIINEAYFTVQDGTASRADIDRAMQLGTNYPHGPFAWCERIGIAQVYRLLEDLYNDTHDERYRVAPLLKKDYLKSQHQSA
jgi:3-hydroxybutyryl-CoA dehydrogenase